MKIPKTKYLIIGAVALLLLLWLRARNAKAGAVTLPGDSGAGGGGGSAGGVTGSVGSTTTTRTPIPGKTYPRTVTDTLGQIFGGTAGALNNAQKGLAAPQPVTGIVSGVTSALQNARNALLNMPKAQPPGIVPVGVVPFTEQ